MPAWYQIHWLPDGPTKEYFGTRGNYYEFSETDRLDLHTALIWCYRCESFSDGEYLSTVEEIDQQMRDLHDPSSMLYCIILDGVHCDAIREQFGEESVAEWRADRLQEKTAELERRRRWREGRMSPPKCIQCGTTRIVPLTFEGPIPNPCGDGIIQVDVVGHCSTDFNNWYYTPEGDRIPRETRPSYWHHPAFDKLRRENAPE